jgi:hypothetical protein
MVTRDEYTPISHDEYVEVTHDAQGRRTDVFRPGVIDPADFEYEREYPPIGAQGPMSEWFAECAHCGARFIYGAWFRYKPTGQHVLVGHTCAHYLDSTGRVDYLLKRHRTELRNRMEREREEAELNAQLEAHPELADALRAVRIDEADKLFYRGDFWPSAAQRTRPFSERHLEALLASLERINGWIREREEKRAAEPQATEPLAEGRRELVGTILSTKVQDSVYGSTLKMLVRLDDGNKVWGTVPEHLERMTFSTHYYDENGSWQERPAELPDGLKGARIAFTATVERSRDDEHFGFYRRPTKTRVIQ